MKKIIFDVSGNKARQLEIDAAISFGPFIAFLKKRIAEEQTVKAKFYNTILEQFAPYHLEEADIPLEEVHQYDALLEHIYACLSPLTTPESQLSWALCFPFHPVIFYGTDALCQVLGQSKAEKEAYVASKTPADYHKERMHTVYSFILKRLYDFKTPVKTEMYHAGINMATGLLQYYRVHMNMDFVEVSAKGELPELNFKQLENYLSEGAGYEILENILPLSLFRFRGFSVLTVSDITAEKAVENIQQVRLARTPANDEDSYKSVIHSLKTLVRDSKIEFDLFPFVTVNDEPVYGYTKGGTGILYKVWGEARLSPEEFRRQAKSYMSNPNPFFSIDIFQESMEEYKFLLPFREMRVRSLAILPAFHHHRAVGSLCMHTWKDETFDEETLALLEPAMDAIGQLFQVYIDEFNLEIENIIKEKFTFIQPSVQWKFNEVAWHYLHSKKKGLSVRTENIHFRDVYPLYGAVDIRNSTIERNRAAKEDLDNHLSLLSATLAAVQPHHHSALFDEMVFNCRKWQQALLQEQLNTTDEVNLNNFLQEETTEFLTYLSQQTPVVRDTVKTYLDTVSSNNGNIYVNKQALESSMQMINTAINNYLESETGQLQQSYPCYFEKFRTDGIEYDIYIGQSLAPHKPFNHFHLKNVRLWQLSSMAAIARLTRSLLPEMPRELRTTQLIFMHNHTIDISFRADERKFDVEGAYNIRYEMIKKRIDKVHIRDSEERLTQPDKIALIYFNKRDLEDYLPFIQYLQETGVLENDMEELELEDLQGLSGLKALRVGVL